MAYWKYLLTLLMLIACSEAAAPLFLQAITSAMATIPLSVGPVSTGLLGAKLGIGAKLLYYLGFFGKSSKPKVVKAPKAAKVSKSTFSKVPQAPAGLQALPLPYALSLAGRFPQSGGFGSGFGGGGFSGGLQPNFQQQSNFGFDPAQVFQALSAQGFDANTVMQIMNYGGGLGANSGAFGANTAAGGLGFNPAAGGLGFNPAAGGLGFNAAAGGLNPDTGEFDMDPAAGGFQSGMEGISLPQGFPDGGMNMGNFPSEFQDNAMNMGNFQELQNSGGPVQEETGEGNESEDVESFFKFLTDMDDNTCISRLMCDIGADPSFLGEFSENIHGIVGSLDVQPTSRAYPYIQIMAQGKNSGNCGAAFPQCNDSSYEVVKNVAPSVGVPDNINSEAINRL